MIKKNNLRETENTQLCKYLGLHGGCETWLILL